ncbi:glucose-1-phosphate cytidylyltransferase [bacterium]|nr:MAG: glucose-1-phosphate cytidylyltransferase [bacterium]
MKTIILAGGYGTRMGNLSEVIPKPMIQIGTMPILWHVMKLYASQDFKDFVLALGYKSNVIKEFFFNYKLHTDFSINTRSSTITYHNSSNEDWNVTCVDTGLNTLKGGRIKRVEKYLDNGINMLTYGDGVADVDINKLVKFHKSHNKILTITGVKPPSRFGELKHEGDKVLSFEEKPQASEGLINGGFMVFNMKLLDYLNKNENCDFEHGPVEKLAKQGEVMVYKHDGNFECADTVREINHLNKLWNENNAFWKKW